MDDDPVIRSLETLAELWDRHFWQDGLQRVVALWVAPFIE